MDGRRRWLDNVFVKRLWCSLKCEEVHLKAYAIGLEACRSIVSLRGRPPGAAWPVEA